MGIGFDPGIASRIRPHVRLSGAGLRLLVEQVRSVSSGAVTALQQPPMELQRDGRETVGWAACGLR